MSTNKKRNIETIQIPENVEVNIEDNLIKFKGPKGTVERRFVHPSLKIHKEDSSIKIEVLKKYTKKEKRMARTFKAHIKNAIVGVTHGFSYALKIVSGHFPMNVSLENDKIVIKNFFGEKSPRTAYLLSNVKASIKGDEIIIESIDKEAAGQSAANIESSTRITKRDRRRFQDGIFIIKKPERQLK